MKKNSVRGYVILGILFALISVIAFVVPTLKTTTFWIAYVFTAAAFAAQVGIWKIALCKEKTLKSKFFGFPVVHISIVYAIIQVVAFAVFMLMPTLPAWGAIVACSVIVGFFAVCMISVEAGRNEIERVEVKVQKKIFYIQELQTDIELLTSNETDTGVKTALKQLAEKVRYSDPMSNGQLLDLEDKITAKIKELKTAVRKEDIIAELNLLIDERNKKCKILK